MYFVQEASKKFLSRGFLSWVGRVTGNDYIFLVGLMWFAAQAKIDFKYRWHYYTLYKLHVDCLTMKVSLNCAQFLHQFSYF